MDLESVKIKLAKYILETDDEAVLNNFMAVMESGRQDWWDALPAEVKESVERGLSQADRGETISHTDAMQKLSRWK